MITQENIPYTADEIKAMVKTCEKYNKALDMAKKIYNSEFKPDEAVVLSKYLLLLFPELIEIEDEDERIRKAIIALIEFGLADKSAIAPGHNVIKEDAIAWLEKQKNTSDKEYVFRPVAGTMIETAIEQALKQGDVVLAFNGFYTPVKGKTFDEILTEYDHWLTKEEALAWLEKQDKHANTRLNINENKTMLNACINALRIVGHSHLANWLERQRTADKIEPKFKVGDWV